MAAATRAIVLINADHYTAWNRRKALVTAGRLCRLDELRLLDLVFSKHQKSQEAWAHRRWVVAPRLPPGPAACVGNCEGAGRGGGSGGGGTRRVGDSDRWLGSVTRICDSDRRG